MGIGGRTMATTAALALAKAAKRSETSVSGNGSHGPGDMSAPVRQVAAHLLGEIRVRLSSSSGIVSADPVLLRYAPELLRRGDGVLAAVGQALHVRALGRPPLAPGLVLQAGRHAELLGPVIVLRVSPLVLVD